MLTTAVLLMVSNAAKISTNALSLDWSQCYAESCYHKAHSPMSWTEAGKFCVDLGAELASVHSREENTFLYYLCGSNDSCWLGFSDAEVEGVWEWRDGSNVQYLNWGDNETNDVSNHDYASIGGPFGRWTDMSDEQANTYAICEKNGTVPFFNSSPCYGNLCYYQTPSQMTWEEANSTCFSLGAELASVHSLEKNTHLYIICGSENNCWVGFNDVAVEGEWEWSDGSNVEFTNWEDGEPNNKNNADYAVIVGETSLWNDMGGSYDAYAICQKSDTIPAIVWSECYGTSCYYKTPSKMLWTEANMTCVGLGVELASIHSLLESTFLFNLCGDDNDCWIGLTDEQVEGNWEWTDGSHLDYENWDSGQPNNYWGQEYVAFDHRRRGQWDDKGKTHQAYGICMKSASAQTEKRRISAEQPTLAPTTISELDPTNHTTEPTLRPDSGLQLRSLRLTVHNLRVRTRLRLKSISKARKSRKCSRNPTCTWGFTNVDRNSECVYPIYNRSSDPTNEPTNYPTKLPTSEPTNYPTNLPTPMPTLSPSTFPTNNPTIDPTNSPTVYPTKYPTSYPTYVPSSDPTAIPTSDPTNYPSNLPTSMPTLPPSAFPTNSPTTDPTNYPTNQPTYMPTLSPSTFPTISPTIAPSNSPTTYPTDMPTVCILIEEWTQARANELCSEVVHHAYGVGLCDQYDHPDLQRRLEFALANQLYSSCDHLCLYDYDTHNTSKPYAFNWAGSCYDVATGEFCIDDERSEMEQSHIRAANLCETSEECVERIDWTQEVAESNCPDGYSNGDKGWGTAKVCPFLVRLYDGFYENADVLYWGSFSRSLANRMFLSCSAKCLYDIENKGVVYQWKRDSNCWEMQTGGACITENVFEYEWAMNYLSKSICAITTPAPVIAPCVERELDWTDEIADRICPADAMGATNKGVDAIVCTGYDDYQSRLDRSLANRAFLTCDSVCVYDLYKKGDEAFTWENTAACWSPASQGTCFADESHREKMTDYIENILCEVTTSEPTEAPTCIQIPQKEWSEELMDEYCSVAATRATYKHYSSIGRAAVPCSGFEDRAADLSKSLAQKMYQGCTSWCVYDWYSNAEEAWKWVNPDQCWTVQTWGDCHYDYKNKRNNTLWMNFKSDMSLMCTHSPTQSPTPLPPTRSPTRSPIDCDATYTWDEARAVENCPRPQKADKSFGVLVCDDDVSRTKQASLEKSLANKFFKNCGSWCVYDYDTIINNIKTGSEEYGGFTWKNPCYKWVTGFGCFENNGLRDFQAISTRAEDLCDAIL